MDLHGQRVVVLGGTSGIGLATAKAAARCGAEVTVVSRQPASVDRALADLPPGARGRASDLTDPALACRLFADLGNIDHLVFTAGEPLALMGLATLDLDRARDSSTCVTSARYGLRTPLRRTWIPAARSP
jgi:NAD(P)-dependent dehydrogenase (short-subunit alcohol dehydrogenase family)